MRWLAFLALLMVPALAQANGAGSGTVGVNAGYAEAGLWDVYTFDHLGGTAVVTLDWEAGVFPCGASYDLVLYPPGSFDDRRLTEQPIAVAEARGCGNTHQGIAMALPSAKYVVAVVPHQAEGEGYWLEADPGWVNYVATAAGTEVTYPF